MGCMSAEIIPFRPRCTEICPSGDFRKALMAIMILEDCSTDQALQVVALWMARGLITEDEALALHAFYGWE